MVLTLRLPKQRALKYAGSLAGDGTSRRGAKRLHPT